MKARILAGTETIARYSDPTMQSYRGIPTYGRGHGGIKIPRAHIKQARDAGYVVLHVGTFYAYVSLPPGETK